MSSKMFEGVKSYNPYKGCKFNCVYCEPSFQRQMKRQLHNCRMCYDYTPHFHPEYLKKVPKNYSTLFLCAFGDVYWCKWEWAREILEVVRKNPQIDFYTQSKNPVIFKLWELKFGGLPDNLVVGATIETNRRENICPESGSKYQNYEEISDAPPPLYRIELMNELEHKRKYAVVEPVLDFDMKVMSEILTESGFEFVYIGYDNHNCKLPEPRQEKLSELIGRVVLRFEVRTKEVERKAWWEKAEAKATT